MKSSLCILSMLVLLGPVGLSESTEVTWITRYCNEEIQVAQLGDDPRMIRNISNSLMIEAPAFLNGSTYLQRRSDTNLCPDWAGIAELSTEWLRPNRVDLATPAVIVVAVNEQAYPTAGSLLLSQNWTALNSQVLIDYYEAPRQLTLYAGLVPAGPVSITGNIINDLDPLQDEGTRGSHYFFFQESTAFSPETVAQFQSVAVPEPSTLALASIGSLALIVAAVCFTPRVG
jgi:hypothetical protein